MLKVTVSKLALFVLGVVSAVPQGLLPHGTATPVTHAALMPSLGHHHHPVTTSSVEAQAFFDQGLTLVYAFNHEEAVQSLRRAAELHLEAPMTYWGIALVAPNTTWMWTRNTKKQPTGLAWIFCTR